MDDLKEIEEIIAYCKYKNGSGVAGFFGDTDMYMTIERLARVIKRLLANEKKASEAR